jgi:hypothetical protein
MSVAKAHVANSTEKTKVVQGGFISGPQQPSAQISHPTFSPDLTSFSPQLQSAC